MRAGRIHLFQGFYPKEDCSSTYQIDFAAYYKKGYRGILFDVDNTLVEHDQPVTEQAKKLFAQLHEMGFATCVISNNKEYRVKPFADAVQTEYIFKADKPSRKGYQEGMHRMKTNPSNTLFVGDQVFTDIWGANRADIHSILVKQIAKHEEIQIVFKRKLEQVALRGYWKEKRMRKRNSQK